MKIGILTFHASHNYGSMLQAYALQHYLITHGHDVETINLRIQAQKEFYRHPLAYPSIPQRRKYYFKTLANPLWVFHACRKWQKYEKFIQENLRLTSKEYGSWEEIKADLPQLGYRCLITGGDQIWNMNCLDFSEAYYLPEKLDGIKKISYSPSFGDLLMKKTSQQEAFIKETLADFSSISVRESSMQEYLSTLLGRNVCTAVDPTLLLNAKDYEHFIDEEPLIKGKYIYFYSPYRNQGEDFAKKIANHYELPIVTSAPHIYHHRGYKSAKETGPKEFLNLVKNATLLIGKSLHLVIFSLLFHKEFIAIDGENDARIHNILQSLGILERGMITDTNYRTFTLHPIDYPRIDQLLDERRAMSQNFLETALSDGLAR